MLDENSVFHHYRSLIALRHEHPVVALGDFNMLLERDPNIYAFTRTLAGEELLVLGNFSSDVVTAEVPDAQRWVSAELLLGNYNVVSAETSRIVLRPWEARIYRREQGATGKVS
jgi:oligo-1,6-glucosidase